MRIGLLERRGHVLSAGSSSAESISVSITRRLPSGHLARGQSPCATAEVHLRQALASKAGKHRLKTISKADRQAIARQAAEARWSKKKA